MSSVTAFALEGIGAVPPAKERPLSGWKRAGRSAPSFISTGPNLLVRWAFYLSVFAIPFGRLYLPGTGDRIGVTRLLQALILAAILAEPRLCLRRIPVALLWFLAYCVTRLLWGWWMTPQLVDYWWPSTLALLQFSLPWLWFMFNVLQHPEIGRGGLWAFAWGCSLCALLHIAGIGTVMLNHGIEGRSTVFGENANVVGSTYGTAIIVMVGLGMLMKLNFRARLLVLPLVALLGIGLALTGSRTSALMTATGVCVLMLHNRSFVPGVKRYLTILLMVAVLGVVVYQVPTVIHRMETFRSSDPKDEPRMRMFPVLWEIFLRHPVLGSGPDHYQDELTRRALPYWIKDQKTVSAHHLALRLLVEMGLVGFVIYGVGLGSAVKAAWRARLNSCGLLPLAMIVPLVIAGVTSSDPHANPVYWFVMAYALAGRI